MSVYPRKPSLNSSAGMYAASGYVANAFSYFEGCHPQFPILAEYADFMRSWDQSEFLLCTIFAIAAKEIKCHAGTRAQLEPHIRTMAAQISSFRDRPLQAVQAFLLLCWWPASYSAKTDDPSWLYAGQALHIALQHGLHRPHHHSDFVYQTSLDDEFTKSYQRAWAGCFIVNQM